MLSVLCIHCFHCQVRRCDEMARRMRFFKEQVRSKDWKKRYVSSGVWVCFSCTECCLWNLLRNHPKPCPLKPCSEGKHEHCHMCCRLCGCVLIRGVARGQLHSVLTFCKPLCVTDREGAYSSSSTLDPGRPGTHHGRIGGKKNAY